MSQGIQLDLRLEEVFCSLLSISHCVVTTKYWLHAIFKENELVLHCTVTLIVTYKGLYECIFSFPDNMLCLLMSILHYIDLYSNLFQAHDNTDYLMCLGTLLFT